MFKSNFYILHIGISNMLTRGISRLGSLYSGEVHRRDLCVRCKQCVPSIILRGFSKVSKYMNEKPWMQVTTMDVEYSYESINSHLLSEVEAEGGEGRVRYIWNNFLTQKVPPPRDVFSPSVPTIHKYHCHVVTYVQISFCEQGKHGRR